MEHRVTSEYDKQKEILSGMYRKRFGDKLAESDIEYIIESMGMCLSEMIKLMREGKSAHEKFFSDIILNSVDAILGFNDKSEIFLWNKGAERMFGWTKEEVIGKDFALLIPPELLAKGEKEKMLDQIHEQGFIVNYETDRLTKTGEIKHVSISRYVIFDEKSELIGNVGIVRDITHERKLEKELRERENLALIGEVVSSIAHNLSNPLNIISGNADYLLIDKKKEDEGFEELKVIVDEATRITKSIRQILNFARPFTLMREKVDINQFLNDITDNVKYLYTAKKIQVKKNFTKDIPDIKIDKELFHDVVLNLVSNSIQAITKEGFVELKTQVKNNKLIIYITDNGTGIPEADIEKIFKPFFSTKGYGKGTGLGLSFAERVIKEHGGQIEVKSSMGLTTFIISLPFLI